jgi:HEAT repeat protein
LEVLSTLGDKRVVPAVMGALDDHDPLVRGYAARALGTIGDKRAVPYLSARLGSETVEEVKESLRRAIDKLNGFSVKGD